MGILDLVKKQFVAVIDWVEPGDGILAWRYPMADREIQNGGQLTVRESQLAMFVNEGEVADVFEPGLHTLNTKNLPLLTTLKNWDKAFQSPFKSDVYFFSTRDQLDRKWGTPQPITIRDKEFGPIRLRAFGTYSFKLKNPKVFYKKVSGTRDTYTAEELDGQLKSAIMTSMASALGGATVAFVDMAANQSKFSETLQAALAPMFDSYGLQLQTFYVQSLSLPEELQQYLDKAGEMRMVGDLRSYTQFQSAQAIGEAAKHDGGIAGAGVGLGAGAAIGQAMAGALGGGGASGGPGSEDAMATLKKLHDLLTQGVISQAEFDAKKAELLKKI
jgi:membrane protease subunit (stomatin/prohibitin family)